MDTMKKSLAILVCLSFIISAVFVSCAKEEEPGGQTTQPILKTTASAASASSVVTARSTAASAAKTAEASSQAATDDKGTTEEDSGEGAGETDSGDVDVAEGTDGSETGSEPEPEKGFTAGNIDFGGRTIVLSAWGAKLLPRPADDPIPPIAELLLKYNQIKKAEEKYNFKMEYRVIPNFTLYQNTIISETLAGMVFADIIRVGSGFAYPGFVKQKLILPLDEYIDYASPIVQANQYMVKSAYWMGRYYGITSERENAISKCLWNKDILDREGQPDILDLIEKDQWNWQTFLDIAKNCTRDLDGDGITDQWGVTTVKVSNISTLPFYMLASNNVLIVDFDDNDKPYFTLTDPAAQRALQFASDLAFIHKVYVESPGGQDSATVYKNGMAAMYLNNPTYNVKFLASGMQSMLAHLPKGPDTDSYVNISSVNFEVLPVNCKDPRDVARMYFEVCVEWDEDGNRTPELEKIYSDTIGYDFDWNPANPGRRWSTEREFLLVIKHLWSLKTPDFSGGFGSILTNLIRDELFKPIMAGTKSVSQGVDQIKEEAQAIIEDAVK
ncbi:MAG: hypothetical protein PHG48_08320 [Eubacteriales bacterium]|nr:hypothetical protein [Eubacteriales bacterium]